MATNGSTSPSQGVHFPEIGVVSGDDPPELMAGDAGIAKHEQGIFAPPDGDSLADDGRSPGFRALPRWQEEAIAPPILREIRSMFGEPEPSLTPDGQLTPAEQAGIGVTVEIDAEPEPESDLTVDGFDAQPNA